MSANSPEKRWSWVIAFACCFINCLLYGVTRLSGLLLVATVDTFQVSRAKAALPYSVSTSVRNLSGIFVGYLGQKFGLSKVISAGCFLAFLGAASCFFTSDIMELTVCWGTIFGTGCGLATCLLPFAITQHFDQNRGTASGISYSGSYIGSFIFPPVVVLLLDYYGLSGTFLVISGTMLNGLAVAIFFRSPPLKSDPGNHSDKLAFTKTSSEIHRSSDQTCSHFKCFLHKLSDHIKLMKFSQKTIELPSERVLPPIYLMAHDKDDIKYSINVTHHGIDNTDIQDKEIPFMLMNSTDMPQLHDGLTHVPPQSCLLKSKSKTSGNIKKAIRTSKLLHLFRNNYDFNHENFARDSIRLTYFKYLDCFHCLLYTNEPNRLNANQNAKNSNQNFMSLEVTSSVSNNHETETEETNARYTVSFNEEKDMNAFSQLSIDRFCLDANAFSELSLDHICLDANSNIPLTKSENFQTLQGNVDAGCNDLNRISIHYQGKTTNLQSFAISSTTEINSESSSPVSKKESRSKNGLSNGRSSLIRSIGRYIFGWLRLFSDPMFGVITITMSLHTFVIVCMVTIIEDFAKDIHVAEHRVHHVIMVLSSADLLGSLCLGVVTDRGLMSRNYFIALCFFGTGVCAIAISFSNNLITLLVLVAFYGVFETGVIITFPLLIAQFIRKKKQPVAMASSNVLSAPTVLLVPLLIGYFRDQIGCYSGIFYILGGTSFGSCIIWLLAPYVMDRCRRQITSQIQASVC